MQNASDAKKGKSLIQVANWANLTHVFKIRNSTWSYLLDLWSKNTTTRVALSAIKIEFGFIWYT